MCRKRFSFEKILKSSLLGGGLYRKGFLKVFLPIVNDDREIIIVCVVTSVIDRRVAFYEKRKAVIQIGRRERTSTTYFVATVVCCWHEGSFTTIINKSETSGAIVVACTVLDDKTISSATSRACGVSTLIRLVQA